MKVLVYHDQRGPAVVFLPPDGSNHAAVPDDGMTALNAQAYGQVAARGQKASWQDHCRTLVASAPYAGRWSQEDVTDGSTAGQALAEVRRAHTLKSIN